MPRRPSSTLGRRESNRRNFFSRLRLWLVIGAILGLTWLVWVKFEWLRPIAELREPLVSIGQNTVVALDVTESGSGLRSVEVALEAGGTRFVLLSEEYPATTWRGSAVHERSFDIPVDPRAAKIPEGEATLLVRATDYSWLNLLKTRRPALRHTVEVDYTPPTVEVLTGQHYLRLGGSEMVVYRTSPDAVRSGVEVDRYFFPGTSGVVPDASVVVAMFAVPQDLGTGARPKVVAEDRSGNRREVPFWVSVKPRRFAEKTLEIGQDFLQQKIPDLLSQNDLPPSSDLLDGYLVVNRELRVKSEERIREICARPANEKLWTGPFLRQPNAAPLSSFADRRTYTHLGKVIDHQTHLGYDLASLRLSEVPAANDGRVAFAGNLGIYGETVVLDHGMGIFSLYGHLSSINVTAEQTVKRGETIGRTGETGLAGGDHLHFSIMLHGVHVDPVEWWDPKWIKDHITGKLESFGKPEGAAVADASAR